MSNRPRPQALHGQAPAGPGCEDPGSQTAARRPHPAAPLAMPALTHDTTTPRLPQHERGCLPVPPDRRHLGRQPSPERPSRRRQYRLPPLSALSPALPPARSSVLPSVLPSTRSSALSSGLSSALLPMLLLGSLLLGAPSAEAARRKAVQAVPSIIDYDARGVPRRARTAGDARLIEGRETRRGRRARTAPTRATRARVARPRSVAPIPAPRAAATITSRPPPPPPLPPDPGRMPGATATAPRAAPSLSRRPPPSSSPPAATPGQRRPPACLACPPMARTRCAS